MKGSTYLLMIFGILIAKGLGFVRNIFFAPLGGTALTDIYFQVFDIPTLVFTGIGTALATLVIKKLNKPENRAHSAQKEYVSRFICNIAIIVLGITALLYLAAPMIVRWLLPGLDPTYYAEAQNMFYIMLPSGLFVIIAYIISGILQNNNVFFVTSIMSLPYNVTIITYLIFAELDIFTISWITTLGWFLHIVILLPDFYRKGYRFFYKDRSRTEAAAKDKNLEIFYIFISSIMFQICIICDKAAVSESAGAGTAIHYATNFFITIVSIFVVAMSNVSFPSISKNYENGNQAEVRKTTQQLIQLLFTILIPFILVTFAFGEDIIRLLYEGDDFTPALTKQTAALLIIYTLGVFGYVCQDLFNKLLYLGSIYKYTVIGSVAVMLLKPLINLLVADLGVMAIASSTAVLFTGYAVLIAITMAKVTGNYIDKELGVNLAKILGAGLAASGVYIIYCLSGIQLPGGNLSFVIPLLACFIVYLAVIWLSGILKIVLPKRATQEN